MAEEIHHVHSSNDTSAATILVSVVIVLVVAAAFYFGVIRGGFMGDSGGAGGEVNVELNTPFNGAGGEGAGGEVGQ